MSIFSSIKLSPKIFREFSTEENDVSFETAADINSLELHHPKTISSEEDAVLLTPKQSPSSNPEISSNQPTTLGLSTSPKSKGTNMLKYMFKMYLRASK